jgi:intracellular septation protein
VKSFFEILPLILFFVAFKLYGVFVATGVAVAVSLVQVGVLLILRKKVELMQWITLIVLVVFGGVTLLFHDEMFIKWKPTVVNAFFALAFLGSQWVGDRPFIQRMLESKVSLSSQKWKRLNLSWVVFFIFLAVVNLYVAYQFSTDVWVNFKIFGILGLTLLFTLLQGVFLLKGVAEKKEG